MVLTNSDRLKIFGISKTVATFKVGDPVASDVKAVLDTDGILKFTGSGDTQIYENQESVPWRKYKDDIRQVTFENDVAPNNLNYYFSDHKNLLSVSIIPDTVEEMAQTFSNCPSLQEVPNIPRSTAIG